MSEEPDARTREGRVLVVDDVASARTLLKGVLQKQFEVLQAASGEEALEYCEQQMPDLILLDMEMPGIGGLETCRMLREMSDVPVIFVTGNESLDEHMKAYDAGGTDISVKPVNMEILTRKMLLAIAQHRIRKHLSSENTSLQKIAKDFMSSLEDSDLLLNFTRQGLACRDHDRLAQLIIDAAAGLGVKCAVAIRHDGEETIVGSQRPTSELERSMIQKLSKMGRHVQMKGRIAINYATVSVIATNAPDNENEADRLRDALSMLAGAAEALSENVSMRKESASRAEQMQVALGNAVTTVEKIRVSHRQLVADIRLRLQAFSDEVEHSYSWMAADRGQEEELTSKLHVHVERILRILLASAEFENDFAAIIESLSTKQSSGNDIELF